MTANRAELVRVFHKWARAVSDHDAGLARACAGEDEILALLPDEPTWDLPHVLAAAVEWLIDSGQAPDHHGRPDAWPLYRAAILDHADWVRDFVRDHRVQTNEVQRCFALLPIFLTLARWADRPLELIELGASAGLNLLWDNYQYSYAAGSWGLDGSPLVLSGDERGRVPSDLLGQQVAVSRRLGIDLNPLDVRDADDVRLLRVFSARHRHERLMTAVAVARREPPEVLRGDYLALLPGLLAGRAVDSLTVVYQTLSSIYLSDAQRARLRAIVDEAGAEGPLAYVWTPTPEEHGQRRGDYPIELALWPGPRRRFIARMENHGEWLDWLG